MCGIVGFTEMLEIFEETDEELLVLPIGDGLSGTYDLRIFVLPLIVFMIVLYLSKIISLSSMCSVLFITVYIGLTDDSIVMLGALSIFTILIIWRHQKNIEKMIHGEENKITWM